MRRRTVVAVLTVLLAVGCTSDKTSGRSVDPGTRQPTGNGQVVKPTGDVILAPINVPSFGGDAAFSPNSPRRLEELIRERCEDGSLCVRVTYHVDPPGTDPFLTAQDTSGGTWECRTTSIEPHGDAIPAGTPIAVAVDCNDVIGLLSQNGGEQDATTDNGTETATADP